MRKLKVLIEGNKDRYDRYSAGVDTLSKVDMFFCERGSLAEDKYKICPDPDIMLVDAISTVPADVINMYKDLKMIHSEGVAYNGIDIAAAKKAGVYVCNNAGCNSSAVAEQAIMLMLELLRKGIVSDAAVREGRQINTKEKYMTEGITELGSCSVGLIGFGDIAKATARRLNAFGCKLYYYTPNRKDTAIEQEYNVNYRSLEDIARESDIVSIHCAVTPSSVKMINEKFISNMKPGTYIVNTARGETVDNEALKKAIIEGRLAGAGLDTVDPEPVTKDNCLLNMPEEYTDRIIFSAHLGGITTGSFTRAHHHMWSNVEMIINGERPDCIVNGL